MAEEKKPADESDLEKQPGRRLKKAVPPRDNPMLRYQAEEAARENEDTDEAEMARLRLKALEQTKRMPTDVNDATGKAPDFDSEGC